LLPAPAPRRDAPRLSCHAMATFLIKTEPTDYAWDDLVRDGSTVWDGVANNAALKHIREARAGDEALLYHTGKEKRIAGLCRITSDPDPNADDDRLVVFDVEPVRGAPEPVTLKDVKADERFAEFALVRQPRLSVMPVPAPIDRALRKMCGL